MERNRERNNSSVTAPLIIERVHGHMFNNLICSLAFVYILTFRLWRWSRRTERTNLREHQPTFAGLVIASGVIYRIMCIIIRTINIRRHSVYWTLQCTHVGIVTVLQSLSFLGLQCIHRHQHRLHDSTISLDQTYGKGRLWQWKDGRENNQIIIFFILFFKYFRNDTRYQSLCYIILRDIYHVQGWWPANAQVAYWYPKIYDFG